MKRNNTSHNLVGLKQELLVCTFALSTNVQPSKNGAESITRKVNRQLLCWMSLILVLLGSINVKAQDETMLSFPPQLEMTPITTPSSSPSIVCVIPAGSALQTCNVTICPGNYLFKDIGGLTIPGRTDFLLYQNNALLWTNFRNLNQGLNISLVQTGNFQLKVRQSYFGNNGNTLFGVYEFTINITIPEPVNVTLSTTTPVVCVNGNYCLSATINPTSLPNSATIDWGDGQYNFPNSNSSFLTGACLYHAYSQAGTYLIKVIVNGACSNAQANVYVTVINALTPPIITDNNQSKCSNLNQVFAVSNALQDYIYTWSVPSGAGNLVPNSGQGTPNIGVTWNNFLATDYISVTATVPGNTCPPVSSTKTITPCCEQEAVPDNGEITINAPGNNSISTNLSSIANLSNYNTIVLNHTLVVDVPYAFNNINFKMTEDARIVLNNNVTLVLNSCVLLAHSGCEKMWDGIYVSNFSQRINANGTTFADARNAIVPANGGYYIIDNCTFENNWIGMDFRGSINDFNGDISASIFTTGVLPYNNNTSLYPPYAGYTKSNAGIVVSEVFTPNYLLLGNPGSPSLKNSFINLSSGIVLKGSKVKVVNNDFSNIYNSWLGSAAGRAISLEGLSKRNKISTYIIGGLAANEANYFDNVQNGVYSSVLTNTNHNMNVYLYKNTMKNIQYKAISINSTNRDIRILTNTIDNFKYGIDLYNNPNAKVIIGNNAINNDFNVPLNFALAYPQAGNPNEAFINNNIDAIRITEIGTKTNYKLNIYNNRIGNFDYNNATYRYACKRGITVTNVKNYPRIVDNIIYQMADPDVNPGNTNAAHYGWGIKCENSNFLSIKDNSITTADRWKWWNDGIRLSNCSDSRLQCNYSFRTSSGIFFDGSQANTLLTNNQMRRNIWGLVVNNGSIGNQSINGMPTDNTWVGPYNGGNGGFYHTLCWGNSIPNATTLGIRNSSGTVYNPPLVQNGIISGGVFQIDAFYTNTLTGNQFNCSSTNTYAQDFSDAPPVTEMIQVINGFYGGDPNYANSEWWMKRALYERAYLSNEILADPNVAEFVGNQSIQPLGLLEEVNGLMYDTIIDTLNIKPPQDWVYLDGKNDAITPSNDIEARYREVNAIIISLNLQEGLNLTESQTQQLQDIAKLCPSEYGPGVYTARAVLRGMRDEEEVYMNDCEIILPFESTSNSRSALHKPQADIGNEEDDYKTNKNAINEVKIKIQDNFDLLVYPNPAQNTISVLLSNYKTTDVSYAIIDAQGKSLLITKATTNNDITTFDVSNINTGLYLLQAIIDGQLIATQKISIIK